MTKSVAGGRRQGAGESSGGTSPPPINETLRTDLRTMLAELGGDAAHPSAEAAFEILASGEPFTSEVAGRGDGKRLQLFRKSRSADLPMAPADGRRWLAIVLTVLDEWDFEAPAAGGRSGRDAIAGASWTDLASVIAQAMDVQHLAYGRRTKAEMVREIAFYAGVAPGAVAFSRDYVDAVAASIVHDRVAPSRAELDGLVAHMDGSPWRGVFYEDLLLELRRTAVRHAPLDVRERLLGAIETYAYEAVMGRPKAAQMTDWRSRHRDVLAVLARDTSVTELPLVARLKLGVDLQSEVQRALFSDDEIASGLAYVEKNWAAPEIWRDRREDETAVEFFMRVYAPLAKENRPYAHQLKRADAPLYRALQAAIANNLRRHVPNGPFAGVRGLADLFPTLRRTDDLPSPARAVALVARRRELARKKRLEEKEKK